MHPHVERILLTKEEIAVVVDRLGKTITKDYADKNLLVVGVLTGGTIFAADLIRSIDLDCELDFVGVSSYGNTAQSGDLTWTKPLSLSPKGKDVLVIEDILDTGRTLSCLTAYLQEAGANSVKLCVMLDKPECRIADITADYVGHSVGNEFIVGYGLDYAQQYHNLPYIGVLKPEQYQ